MPGCLFKKMHYFFSLAEARKLGTLLSTIAMHIVSEVPFTRLKTFIDTLTWYRSTGQQDVSLFAEL